MADRTLLLKLVTDLGSIKKDTQTMTSGLSRLGSTVKGLGAGLGIGLGMAVAVDQMGAAIDVASDLAEQTSKVGVVFGDSADEVQAWARDLDASFGLGERSALALAGQIGNLGTALGLSEKDAAAMATSIGELAGDLASFHNADVAEVVTALQSGLVGETEPLRRLGVNLSAAAVDAHALASGMADSKAGITDAMRVQARYQLILEQTTKAQGDAARTADTYAGKQRQLGATIEDLQAKVGGFLLAAAEPLLGFFAGLVDVLNGPEGVEKSLRDVAARIDDVREAQQRAMAPSEWDRWSAMVTDIGARQANAWQTMTERAADVLEVFPPGRIAALAAASGDLEGTWAGLVALATRIGETSGDATTDMVRFESAFADYVAGQLSGWKASDAAFTAFVGSQAGLWADWSSMAQLSADEISAAYGGMSDAAGGYGRTVEAVAGRVRWAFDDMFTTAKEAQQPWKEAWRNMAAWAKDPFRPAQFERWINRRVREALREATDPENSRKVRRRWRQIAAAMRDPVLRAVVAIGMSVDDAVAAILVVQGMATRLRARLDAIGGFFGGGGGGGGGRSAGIPSGPAPLGSAAGLTAGTMAYGGSVLGGSAAAPTININVTGGLSDPAGAGRAIVKAIRAYEVHEGATWRGGTGAIRAR